MVNPDLQPLFQQTIPELLAHATRAATTAGSAAPIVRAHLLLGAANLAASDMLVHLARERGRPVDEADLDQVAKQFRATLQRQLVEFHANGRLDG